MSFRSIKYFQMVSAGLLSFGLMCACSFRDSLDECGLRLHFSYDYNMAYADAAPREIDRIDVLVFDADGRYLFTRTAGQKELDRDNHSITFFGELAPGTYTFFTWGGLSDDFQLSDDNNPSAGLISGQTRIENIRLKMTRVENGVCSQELHPVWYGTPRTVSYTPRSGRQTQIINLIKNTNRFHITLTEENMSRSETDGLLDYVFEIISDGDELYGPDNRPAGTRQISFFPYRVSSDNDENTSGELNTMRLLSDASYTLVIRSAYNHKILWSKDLLWLLGQTQPHGIAALQEYLDRQDEWSLVFNYKTSGGDAFVAVSVTINGWTIWFQNADL